jgi:hypothetical protein
VETPEAKETLERSRRKWEDNVKRDLKETEQGDEEWINQGSA